MRNAFVALFGLFLLYSGCCGYFTSEGKYSQTNDSLPFISPPQPNLDAKIAGCDSGLSLSGETTTVYVTISNSGDGAAENVSVTFSASDSTSGQSAVLELGRVPAGKQRTVSYAMNTDIFKETNVGVVVKAKDTYDISEYTADCSQLDSETLEGLNKLVQVGLRSI